jgi:branched-chain amino acid transport system permease protein
MVSPIYIDALIYSSILSLLCLGLTLTYMTTKVPNFAHASFAMIGAYVTWTLVNSSRVSAAKIAAESGNITQVFLSVKNYTIPSTVYAETLVLSFLIVGIVAVVQYLLVLKPLSKRGSSITGLMIATIAVDMFIFALLNIYADYMQSILVDRVNQLGMELGRRVSLLVNACLLYTSPSPRD